MALEIRTAATTAGGAPKAVSLGGRPSNAAPSASKHGFWDVITTAHNDAGHTDYRIVYIYNTGPNQVTDVTCSVSNKGGGSTVTVALCSVATAAFASYNTSSIANDTTAPSQVSGPYQATVTIGTLNSGQVKAVWLKRVTTAETPATTDDLGTIVASGKEVIPAV